ncbi:DUF2752 domain-containing protein [Actinomycetota bacterium]
MRGPLLWGAVGVAAFAAVSATDPNTPGHLPACPFLTLTGLYCPGCGFTRSTWALGHGDLAGAFARHPLVPLLWLGAAALVVRALLPRRPVARRWPQWTGPAIGVAVLLFTIARNVPGWSWLSPA